MLKVQAGEHCIASVLIQNNGRATNVSCLFNSPEADVFLATADESEVVDRAKLYAQDVEVRSLTRKDFGFFVLVDFRDVPHDDQFLVVCIFTNTCQETAIRRERETLHGDHRHW